jgi:type IV secretion system protein VirD4
MSPTKLLLGQIVVVFAIVVLGIWFATQWVAARLDYQPELGHPSFTLFDIAIYRPWSIFAWWYHFDVDSEGSRPPIPK